MVTYNTQIFKNQSYLVQFVCNLTTNNLGKYMYMHFLQVYDRLAVVGVTTCFQGAGRLVDEIGKHNYDAVIQSLKNGNALGL